MNQSEPPCERSTRSWQRQRSREPTGDTYCGDCSSWRLTSTERGLRDGEMIRVHQRQKDFSVNDWTSCTETQMRLQLLQLRTGPSRWSHRGAFSSMTPLRTATVTFYNMEAWQRRWCSCPQIQIRRVSCQRSSRLRPRLASASWKAWAS